jgi:hypothetical protein
MTMRFLGRAALPAAAVLATIAIAIPASGSPAGLPQRARRLSAAEASGRSLLQCRMAALDGGRDACMAG